MGKRCWAMAGLVLGALVLAWVAMPATVRAETNPDTTQTSICLMLESAARAYELPLEFFARLIWRESRFRAGVVGPKTRSGKRAQGIAQFMPATAAERGLLDPFDPVQALPKSAEFLQELRRRFGNLGLAAAAYKRSAPCSGLAQRRGRHATGDARLRHRDHGTNGRRLDRIGGQLARARHRLRRDDGAVEGRADALHRGARATHYFRRRAAVGRATWGGYSRDNALKIYARMVKRLAAWLTTMIRSSAARCCAAAARDRSIKSASVPSAWGSQRALRPHPQDRRRLFRAAPGARAATGKG